MQKLKVAVNERGLRIGEDHQNARYTNREIEMVHELRDSGMSYGKIMQIMEMPKSTIASIARGCRRCQFAAQYKIIEVM